MSDSKTSSALSYYAAHGCALFPIPAGQKSPVGIVGSFALDCSTDVARWQTWLAENPGCNWGVVAGASRLIIVDIDTATDAGREAAWAAWCELCASWGVETFQPHVQSARGGWHVYFAVPDNVDAKALRQPDAIKGIINVRAGNGFTVAAGSHFTNLPYLLLSDVAPYPAPPALVAHCARSTRRAAINAGTRDRGDVAALINWLVERDQFSAYEDWVGVGMALKLEFGDDGLEVWQLTHNATVDADTESVKWDSFATDPAPGVQTLNTWLDRAHKLGWRGSVRKSTSALFDGVAALAAASGAKLSSGTPSGAPGPADGGGIPMLAGQEALARLGAPILSDFLSATADTPARPTFDDYPLLPEAAAGHGLYGALQDCIRRILAMAETHGKMSRTIDAAACLSLVHVDVFEAVGRRCNLLGSPLPVTKIKLAASALADKVEREFVKQDDWIYDPKGLIEQDNSDNVAVFLGIVGCEIRWNAWLERAEIRGFEGEYTDWIHIDDTVVAKLRTRGNRTKTRFRPGKDFFWESLLSLAHANPFDPVRDLLETLAETWDGKPRLSTWLSAACGVECDPYHQAVSRNIIGGMVRRVLNPGCKHDTMPVFFGPQGTGKSTLALILALSSEWFTDSVLLGDASKELVLSLAGKMVVELSEMGMRGSANSAHVKKMISAQFDEGRTAYARAVSRRQRRNIFIGTTNDDEPLQDHTGNRRFLPVRIDREIDLAWLRANIGQLVGEAVTKEAAGKSFDLPREVWSDAAARQESARAESDSETMLLEWFGETPHTAVAYILATDLVHITSLAGWRHGGSTAARSAIMKRMGFVYENIFIGGKRTRLWARAAETRPRDIPRVGVRYMVGQDNNGRPQVTIRAPESEQPNVTALPAITPGPR